MTREPPASTDPTVALVAEFDGAAFAGWQRQPRAPTVQGAIEDALAKIYGVPVVVQGAGRTDAGVHAAEMTATFRAPSPSPPPERLPIATAPLLPDGVSILSARAAPGLDARRDALLRWYRYQISLDRRRRPLGPRAWRVMAELDVAEMARAVAALEGERDFAGFRSAGCTAPRTLLTMREASLKRSGDLIAIDFKCRSFLQRQVRLMIGAIVEVGRGRATVGTIERILRTGERPATIPAADPHGLCLMRVAYDEAEAEAILESHPPPPSF